MVNEVASVRSFNRFYTKQIGVLRQGYLDSQFSLAQVRVLYELAHRDGCAAVELGKELGLDAGYLSRLLASFQKRGIVTRKPSESDARQHCLSLTAKGRRAFTPLEESSKSEVAGMLNRLSIAERKRLVESMQSIETLLGGAPEKKAAYVLRAHRPGDVGWVVHRHGVLYAQEYGWDERFEALVAEITAKFIQDFRPKQDRCWIAESDDAILGSVFLVRESKEVAKLRLLLVEPQARGLGIGRRLVDECVQFGRQARYKRITLWTQSILVAARHIYERAGFQLVREERHRSFGSDLVGETWELEL